jgi:hypothetical protein
MAEQPKKRILYCRCAYAQAVPPGVKDEVLRQLGASGVAFEAVSDLCEMSANNDPRLKEISDGGNVRICACFPRAVKWLFHSAGADLPAGGVEVMNMRSESANDIVKKLLSGDDNPENSLNPKTDA